jgi:CBS domain containing-hemolysin-like protein
VNGAALTPDLALLLMLVALVGSAFFSGAETGLMSVSRVRLSLLARQGDGRVDRLLRLRDDLDDAILTCLVGTNLSNVLASAVATALLTALLGPRGEGLAVVAASLVLVVFGEILPKIVYREYAERLTLASLRPLLGFRLVIWPLRAGLRAYSRLLQRLAGPVGEVAPRLDRTALAALLATDDPDPREQRFQQTMERFLRLSNRRLGELMRPLAEVVALPAGVTLERALAVAAGSGFSRLPVRGTGGDLEGYLLVRDLLLAEGHLATSEPVPVDLIRPLLLVDSGLSPYELFEELHSRDAQLAAVVDPAGRAVGIITLEDLIEKVTGAIADEFDPPEDAA